MASPWRGLWVFGDGNRAQLGRQSREVALYAVRLAKGAFRVAACGHFASLAAAPDGRRLWAWGQADGLPMPEGEEEGAGDVQGRLLAVPTRIRVPPETSIVHMAAGRWRSLAVLDDGGVAAAGRTWQGESIARTLQRMPAVDALGERVVAASCGWGHALMLTAEGHVLAEGYNAQGQASLGLREDEETVPLHRLPLDDVAAVAAGLDHAGAVTRDGAVRLWGYNEYGQASVSTAPLDGVPVTSLALGWAHTALLAADGRLLMGGSNAMGQLGCEDEQATWHVVQPEDASDPFVSVSCGRAHTVAITQHGAAFAWGHGPSTAAGSRSGRVATPTRIELMLDEDEDEDELLVADREAVDERAPARVRLAASGLDHSVLVVE